MSDAGFLLVNKPCGVTSHDIVEVVRRKLGLRRVGHAGTLDPIAEGLLVVLVGSATKRQHACQQHEKVYEATMRLGMQTDTGDATGRMIHEAAVPRVDERQVREALAAFEGAQSQTPPAYSAVKVRGKPAYWWARRQQPVTLAPRPIVISAISLLRLEGERITFQVRCSAGTYVRVLAEAIAQRLGTVGHVDRLVRLRVGSWSVSEAHPLDWLTRASPDEIRKVLL